MVFFEKLESLYENKESNLISWEELAKVDSFALFDLNNKGTVKAKRIPVHGDYLMMFECTGEEGAQVEFHKHDCKELFIVESGTVNVNGKDYQSGEKDVVYPGIVHRFYFPEKAKLWVQYFNPIRRT